MKDEKEINLGSNREININIDWSLVIPILVWIIYDKWC